MSSLEASEYIGDKVNDYKKKTNDLLDGVKLLFFASLMKERTPSEFNELLNKNINKYNKTILKTTKDSYKYIYTKVQEINEYEPKISQIKPDKEVLDELYFSLDKKSQGKALDKYVNYVKDYYKTSHKTVVKNYINKEAYLSKKVSKFDKVEKVVRYSNGSYYDISTYNSMVENTNLMHEALNSTFDSAKKLGYDLVYVEPHSYSCPICMEYQGKIYSLTGKTKGYPKFEFSEGSGDIFHPNCKHIVTRYLGQEETDEYSTAEWEEKYEVKQKINGLNLKKSRLLNDKKIYKSLGNQEGVDTVNAQIKKINESIKAVR